MAGALRDLAGAGRRADLARRHPCGGGGCVGGGGGGSASARASSAAGMGSYLNRPCSFGELSERADDVLVQLLLLFETPGSRPGWSLWSPPILFGVRCRECVTRARPPGGSFASFVVPRFSHGWRVKQLKLSTAYEVLPGP